MAVSAVLRSFAGDASVGEDTGHGVIGRFAPRIGGGADGRSELAATDAGMSRHELHDGSILALRPTLSLFVSCGLPASAGIRRLARVGDPLALDVGQRDECAAVLVVPTQS